MSKPWVLFLVGGLLASTAFLEYRGSEVFAWIDKRLTHKQRAALAAVLVLIAAAAVLGGLLQFYHSHDAP